MEQQSKIAASQAVIQREQYEDLKRDKARQPRLIISNPTEEEPEEKRSKTLAIGKPENDGTIRSRLELYLHNYGDGEARDVTIALYMPYELSVYESNGQLALASSYEITDLAVDPEYVGLYDSDHQLHRLKATFAGPFYPGATVPVGFTDVLSQEGTFAVGWRVYSSQGVFPTGKKLGSLSVTIYSEDSM